MCGCNLSLIGIVCLGPAGDFDYGQKATVEDRLEAGVSGSGSAGVAGAGGGRLADVSPRQRAAQSIQPDDCRCGGPRWQYTPDTPHACSAPVAVGNLIFVAAPTALSAL